MQGRWPYKTDIGLWRQVACTENLTAFWFLSYFLCIVDPHQENIRTGLSANMFYLLRNSCFSVSKQHCGRRRYGLMLSTVHKWCNETLSHSPANCHDMLILNTGRCCNSKNNKSNGDRTQALVGKMCNVLCTHLLIVKCSHNSVDFQCRVHRCIINMLLQETSLQQMQPEKLVTEGWNN